MTAADLPPINATLNSITTLLLLGALYFITRGHIAAHRRCMTGAMVSSTIFLACYLTYHALHGATKFTTPGWPKIIYFTILISHTILAVICLPMVLRTFYLGWRRRDEKHRAWAKITWPIWMYVSVTGVIVYLMLYQIYPGNPTVPIPLGG